MPESTGASFTAATVNVTVCVALAIPSLATTLIERFEVVGVSLVLLYWMPRKIVSYVALLAEPVIESTPVDAVYVTVKPLAAAVAALFNDKDSTAFPSGLAPNVTVNDERFAESTSVNVATGAINTGVCSVKAVVTSLPTPPAFRSTTGASFTAATVTVTVRLILAAAPSLATTVIKRFDVVGVSLVLLY